MQQGQIEKLFFFFTWFKQAREDVKCRNKKDAGYKKLYFMRANDLVIIKNHARLKKYDSI